MTRDSSPARQLRTVLITGCSSGIGRAAALQLDDAGYEVVATARDVASLAELAAGGITTLPLDVTDDESMTNAVDHVRDELGGIDVLINNAGYGLYGPIEQVPLDDVRKQFETNVFGLARLTQLVLPAMREARSGRIVDVSSMGGRTALPGGAYYHASKFAVEAFSDVLRIEMAPFGVDVVIIEPGPVRTAWNATAESSLPEADSDDPYGAYKQAVAGGFASASTGLSARVSSDAEDIAKIIVRAVSADRPRTRYLINPIANAFVGLRTVLPDRTYDAFVRRQFGLRD